MDTAISTTQREDKQNVESGATLSAGYDPGNRRVKKVAGGLTTHYVWERAKVIAEYNGSTGALMSEYIHAGSRMVARDQGGVLRYFHQDRLSARLITDVGGAMVGTEDHLPFGEDAGVVGESEKHRFTSYERDSETGSDYAINRQHSNSSGRFVQPDPYLGNIAYPQGHNRYSYTSNDPINSVDPAGLVRVDWFVLGGLMIMNPNFTLDGSSIGSEMMGMVASLWRNGWADIIPGGGPIKLDHWGDPYRDLGDDIALYGLDNYGWGDAIPVKWAINVSCERYLDNKDVKTIYDTFKNKVAELNAKGKRHNNPAVNNISTTLNLISPLGHAYLSCGEQAGRIIESLNGVKDKGLLTGNWSFATQSLPLNLHVWATATSSNPRDPRIKLDPWRNRITCNAPGGWMTFF